MEAGIGSRVQHLKGAREVRAVLNAAMHKYQIQSLSGKKLRERNLPIIQSSQ